ncbi:MAG: maleylpyruvate isomerase family mycothiol-dependent enzyme [Deltaproteobacteria bacterium]|nr:maleylpyruvate isomerase family mycothiol-dependent enzyme [Deltaproteobacteria bacterium]MBW2309035.1 maleylpyruvate isomerase family mycothiol-dependent enzyme [Deltaproteobacteria bacterium]
MKRQTFGLPEADPFSVLDGEIARLNAFFTGLRPEEWLSPTRCQGWSVRDMVAHLDCVEEYNEACLNDDLESLSAVFSDLDDFNDRHIRKRAHLSNEEVLKQWRARQAGVRQAWEGLGLDAQIKTSIGPYPLHAQIWHITSEYATHADDMGAEVPSDQKEPRIRWRVQFSAFAVQERETPPDLALQGDRMIVTFKGHRLSLSLEDFVAAVSARLTLPRNRDDRRIIETLRTLA